VTSSLRILTSCRKVASADVGVGSNSALGRCRPNVRITPESGRVADISGRLKSANNGRERVQQWMQPEGQLLDHLVGAGEKHRRNVQAERLGGPEVDGQLVLGRCLHWKVAGLLAFENAIDINGRASVRIDGIKP
jgi:hypothetical protein